jgi:hypothetical protein
VVRELRAALESPEREEHEHEHGDGAERGDDADDRVLPRLARPRGALCTVLRVVAAAAARARVGVRDRVEREGGDDVAGELLRDGVRDAVVPEAVVGLERELKGGFGGGGDVREEERLQLSDVLRALVVVRDTRLEGERLDCVGYGKSAEKEKKGQEKHALETPAAVANNSGTYANSWLLDTWLWHTKSQLK